MEEIIVKNGLETEWNEFINSSDKTHTVYETTFCLKELESGRSFHDVFMYLLTRIYLMPEDIEKIIQKIFYFSKKSQELVEYWKQNKDVLIDEANERQCRTQEVYREHNRHRL